MTEKTEFYNLLKKNFYKIKNKVKLKKISPPLFGTYLKSGGYLNYSFDRNETNLIGLFLF